MTPSSITSTMRFCKRHAVDREGRQAQRPGEPEPGVGENRERQVQALHRFALVVAVLGRHAKEMGHAEPP